MNGQEGKFNVMEGIDGSGKATQTGLLVARFKKEGFEVETDSYPHYKTSFWGRHVGRMLKGDFGNPMEVSPYLTALPYMLDQANGSVQIRQWLEEGKIVVSDRFFTSNVHQIAKMPEEKREEYASWLWSAGYEELKIQRPDLVVALLVTPEICRANILKKDKRDYVGEGVMDKAEEDLVHQMETAKEYRRMVKNNPDWWVAIECCKEGRLLAPEEIHEMVWGEIKRRGMVKWV